MRPRKYYTINRQSLDAVSDDVEQFINFFVIEFQRIVFAENVYATIAAFISSLAGYLLVKFVPTWGLAVIATSLVYLLPLIYIKNRAVIDKQLHNAGVIINQQTTQLRDLAAEHSNRAASVVQSTASEYSTKAQELIGSAKNRAASPSAPNPANTNPFKNEPEREITKEDFPSAPNPANLNPYKNEPEREITKDDFPSAPSSLKQAEKDFSGSATHHNNFSSGATLGEPTFVNTPIPDTAATIPENEGPEFGRVEDVDGIKAEALAS